MDFSPLWISLKTAFVATVITFIIGIVISYKMANYRGKGRGIIDGIFTLPLILPPTVVGFFLLLICGKNGVIGKIIMSFDKNIIFTWSATVIAATVVSFPMMYRTCRSAFEQIDKNMILAARTLGLSESKIFFKIAIPLAWPGIIGGLVLSFARALGEFGATLMIAGNIPGKTQTMPVAIFFAVEGGDMNKALLWVLIIVAISFIMIFLLNFWSDKQQKLIGNRRK
ncbi:molybdate ABC transporter permease subunit [Clostridium celatum]|uniref:Molybdenum transport system permease n=1 Tax=Clostridium celatum DSM 1785 TaxID=545697 RepID=L1QE27_9CLOT|nr:molybdate ABC transporter permease subunit [Clostridium celatum]EKY26206.1 molybdate ABC transporter, permease protein [Clostridium celatum DSM 1785]MCE9656359.1 molybdate ABC transporter permease subunit [Clostridium celatum]MDU3722166.1 molybdate ABC transporter permease subunit [Clostridium celatum]MDU6295251.1 molybdate ABC transporter permease subunit [Clostridium celatum]MDY3360709.1 molybdate ABC transporter permease subunit [Clostridium celatum]